MNRANGGGGRRPESLRVPWLTIGLVAAGALATVVPGWAEALQYERSRVAAGEVVRLVTGSLPHWSVRMAFWDLVVVGVAGGWVERRSRAVFAVAAALALAGTGVAIDRASPAIEVYRGSSGLATALFAAAAVTGIRDARSTTARAVGIAAVVALLAKIALESAGRSGLAAGPLPPGVRVVPLVHAVGGLAGAVAVALHALARRGRARAVRG